MRQTVGDELFHHAGAVFGEFTRERSAGVDAVVEGHGDVGDDPAEERGGGMVARTSEARIKLRRPRRSGE